MAAWRGRERALRLAGADVALATASRWHAGGVPVELEQDAAQEFPVVGVRTFGLHPALFVYDPRPLWRLLGERWDVIDIHEEPFALSTAEVLLLRALRRNRAPFALYTAQNLRKRYPFPFGWLERRALRAASGISACNREAAAIAEGKGFPGRARVIPLGVDTPAGLPSPAPERATKERDEGRVTVGLLGRLVPEKGVGVLLDALALEPRLHARIAGSGPLADRIEADAATRGIRDRVTFLGALPPEDVPEFYASVDVLAVPSVPTRSWTEQFGRVAIEAMAAGVPVVSSDAGALPDVVGGAGLVVPHGDASALARALVEAHDRRDELAPAGLLRAAECSWTAVAADYEDMYRSAIAPALRQAQGPTETTLRQAQGPDSVEIITVAYGAPDLLERALAPVAGLPVTVVDNSSQPEIAAICERLGVRYLDAGANLGFGSAVNLALADRLVPGADVLLLNPDAAIDPDGIAALQASLHSRPGTASVGPVQVDEQGRPARVEWVFPSPARAWLEAAGLGRGIRGPKFVIGSVLLLNAGALEAVGGFDERFFLYAEETDWAYRTHLLGWTHRAVPTVEAVHTGAGTSSDPRRREAYFHASQERYYRKHFGAAGWTAARAAQIAGATVRGILLPGGRGADARRRAALYRLGPVRVEQRFRRGV
ncbi:glycosyltransferase [Microbacterium bovistercoris]|uniref:glycosyltransferase n=1 Tax=Microbacterium bovistercoris TaxID=2293570 RepID=UPI001FE5BDB4|nr:glycosyltransferase [Microbacterium bovistercoris]